jgi:mannosyl-oligosaccharide alpha-1,3-glucosidase
MQAALRERYALLPYLYTLFRKANETGAPIMRPMFYHFPAEATLFDVDHQFMFGPAILAAPVLERGAKSVDVHIPVGETFYTPSGVKINRPPSGVYKHAVTMDTIARYVGLLIEPFWYVCTFLC